MSATTQQHAEPPTLATLTAYVQEDVAMGLELAAVACDRESDRAAILRGASLIRQLPTVRACRKCFAQAASTERGDHLCDGCIAQEGHHD